MTWNIWANYPHFTWWNGTIERWNSGGWYVGCQWYTWIYEDWLVSMYLCMVFQSDIVYRTVTKSFYKITMKIDIWKKNRFLLRFSLPISEMYCWWFVILLSALRFFPLLHCCHWWFDIHLIHQMCAGIFRPWNHLNTLFSHCVAVFFSNSLRFRHSAFLQSLHFIYIYVLNASFLCIPFVLLKRKEWRKTIYHLNWIYVSKKALGK